MVKSNFAWRNAGLTHRGLVRRENQDCYFISPDGRVCVVADGVGGSDGGAMASRLAVETVEKRWLSAETLDDEGIETWMRETVAEANEQIRSAAEASTSLRNMGTTIVMMVIGEGGKVNIGHVGDSRAIRVRNSELGVLTKDHTLVMELHLRGQLTQEECRVNPYRHLITRCLGHDSDVELDYKAIDPQPGDWYVLASDGLSEVLREDEIGPIVEQCQDPQTVCDKLLERVLERNAPDNTTIVTVACDPVPASA